MTPRSLILEGTGDHYRTPVAERFHSYKAAEGGLPGKLCFHLADGKTLEIPLSLAALTRLTIELRTPIPPHADEPLTDDASDA